MNRQGQYSDEPAMQALQARFASRVTSALSQRSTALPHDISERLRFAREQALGKARASKAATSPGVAAVHVSRSGAMSLGSYAPWWQRALGIAPLVVLVSGLVLIQQWTTHEQVMAAADIDAVLLADDLPPAAYTDPGFGEYLRTTTP
jgi:hypothetical protein